MKNALVTGGIGGIGSAICDALAGKGYHVIANYIDIEKDAAVDWIAPRNKAQYSIACGDVSRSDDMLWMTRDIEREHGEISVLVNCAGITRDSTLKKMSEDDWHSVIDINLTGMFNITHRIIEPMINMGWGRIVNISSVNGQQGCFGQCNYSAAKAGVHGFTMALAREVAAKGITVNTISPGYVDTPMTQAIPDSIRDQIVSTIPMGRMGSPEDIASTVEFLVSDGAAYITGADISVNGGFRIS